jgi:hypothetical protein
VPRRSDQIRARCVATGVAVRGERGALTLLGGEVSRDVKGAEPVIIGTTVFLAVLAIVYFIAMVMAQLRPTG